jgi:RNA polymerase sigma-70 factor (ECF subfamily)
VKEPDNQNGSVGNTDATASSLILGVRQGEADAWQRVSQLYAPLVYAWCRRAGLQGPDAEDILQEVFLTVARRAGEFRHDRPGDSFRGWLYGITRNKIGDWLRRRAQTPRAQGGSEALECLHELAAEGDNSESIAPPGCGGLMQRALGMIRDEFEGRTWQAFWRVVVERHAPADVARDLDITRNAVYIARSRVLRRLREVLGEEAIPGDQGCAPL